MRKYTVTRTWSLSGWVSAEVEAESEAAARRIEAERWEQEGALASLPPRLRHHIEEIHEEVDDVREAAP